MKSFQLSEHFQRQALYDSCIREGMNEARDGRSLNQLTYQELKSELTFFKIKNS